MDLGILSLLAAKLKAGLQSLKRFSSLGGQKVQLPDDEAISDLWCALVCLQHTRL